MEEELTKRIGDAYLNPIYKDGEVLLNTDMNELVDVAKKAINENYYDIQRILNGTKVPSNSSELNGASLSKFINEKLQADDKKVPTAQQVKSYVDNSIAGIGGQTLDNNKVAIVENVTSRNLFDKLTFVENLNIGESNVLVSDVNSKINYVLVEPGINYTVSSSATRQWVYAFGNDIPTINSVINARTIITNQKSFVFTAPVGYTYFYLRAYSGEDPETVQVEKGTILTDYTAFLNSLYTYQRLIDTITRLKLVESKLVQNSLTEVSAGKLKCSTICTLTTGAVISVLIPLLTNTSTTMQLSVDNGTTYYYIKQMSDDAVFNDYSNTEISASKCTLYFDGTQFILDKSKYGGKVINNLNTIIKTGNYTAYKAATGAPYASSWFIKHINNNASTSYATQRAVAYSTDLIIYERTKIEGTWGNWVNRSTINNLTTATAGNGILDAYQGKVLDDKINDIKPLSTSIEARDWVIKNLGGLSNIKSSYSVTTDGNTMIDVGNSRRFLCVIRDNSTTTTQASLKVYINRGSISVNLYSTQTAITDFVNNTTLVSLKAFYIEQGLACFEENTLILTPEGQKKISDIKVGDTILSYNDLENKTVEDKVEYINIHNNLEGLFNLVTKDDVIKVTGDHSFYLFNSDIKRVEDLKIGNWLKTKDGKRLINTLSAEEVDYAGYDIKTSNNNYYIGKDNILVKTENITIIKSKNN